MELYLLALQWPEVCSPHVQGLSFAGTFLFVSRDFKLNGFVIAVAKMGPISTLLVRFSVLASSRSKKASF